MPRRRSPSSSAAVAGALLLLVVLPGRASADRSFDNLHHRAEELTRSAEQAAAAGETARAIELGRTALGLLETADTLRPTASDLRVPFLAVQASVYAGNPAGARAWLARFRQRSAPGEPTWASHWLDAFVAFHVDRRLDATIEALQRMFLADPAAMPEARNLLWFNALLQEGTRLGELGEFVKAIERLREAENIARRDRSATKVRRAREKQALVLQMDARFEEAEAILVDLLKEDPENAYWLWGLGMNRANRNLWSQAIPSYEEALRLLEAGRLTPFMAEQIQASYLRVGNCLRNLAAGEVDPKKRAALFERARERIAQYVRVAPRDVRGHYWMGHLLFMDLQRPHDAIPWLRRAYALDPVCDHSLRLLTQIYASNDPLPVGDEAAQAKAKAEWMAQLEAWEEEEAAWKDARAAERVRREDSPRHDAGCE
jgi:tetratricopeptide (TPR) repeat protein